MCNSQDFWLQIIGTKCDSLKQTINALERFQQTPEETAKQEGQALEMGSNQGKFCNEVLS